MKETQRCIINILFYLNSEIMKKLFFASALVAGMGMLASCSNDEVAVAPGVAPGPGNADLVPIELALGNPTVSVQKRGSGTVGDIADEATNVWNGQDLYVLMTQQDDASTVDDNEFGMSTWTYESANPATDPNVDQQPYVDDPTATIVNFDNELIKAPATGASGALEWTTGPKYYPNEGTHDFFAYHISDAFTDAEPAGALDNKPDITTEANGKQMSVAFTIDGTQDLMVGKAEWKKNNPDDDFATLYPDLDQAADLFTARSARAGVIPNIVMQHLLTRFTFTVEGMGAGAENLQVTKIEVKSKATGKMYVAYDPTAVPENLIEFDEVEPEAYTTFTLMQVDADRADANADLEELKPVTIEKAAEPDGEGVNEDGYAQQKVGDAIMVAPGDAAYSLTVYVQQTFDDDNPTTEEENHPAGVYPYPLTINIPSAQGGSLTDDEKDVAQSGASYNVNIKLYGMEKIELETTLTGWKDGGNIDIDTNAPAGGAEEDPEP